PQPRKQPWSWALERRRCASEKEACPAGERRRALLVGSPAPLGRRRPSPGPCAFHWKCFLKKVSMPGVGWAVGQRPGASGGGQTAAHRK
uniref:Uncharacterized protein n=1 Tax=Chinchilla lanigera TaxID=34839 RepID=A0A8C2VU85_CHILA